MAAVFANPEVAQAYRNRPPYPAEVFDRLLALIPDRPARVLELGAGEGALARPLARRVERVHAVDVSAAMVDAGRHRSGGLASNLRWVVGAAEEVELAGPHTLVTVGAALHWMDWDRVLPRVAEAMAGDAVLCIIEHGPRR